MDDFNMNNKAPLNSSDQNNEQPAAETRNTAPQNEQPVQAPQSEQPMQQPQAEQNSARTGSQSEQPSAGGTACTGQSEQPPQPRTFQTPVQHPEFRQAQQQTGFGEVPPMSQKPHTRRIKAQQRLSARPVRRSGTRACCLGGAVVGNMAFGGNAGNDSGTSASTFDSAPTLQIGNSKPESDSSNSSDNYDTADGMAGEDIYKGQSVGRFGYLPPPLRARAAARASS